ncbi:MAG TPA: TetR/AcrR family transcriptional regulator [Acidimicrobiales bacterium]|jgi:AcrR family transcriptional regulator|nr:TetR/AcrR family transcriptional regulator [Acidimicrobiales bacterium]
MARGTAAKTTSRDERPTVGLTRREARRAELLEAALRVIRRGEGRVAMEDIAAEAGISRPILYRHFGDATGLYAAVADHFCRALLARLRRGTRDLPPGHGLLHHQILSYLTFIDEDPNVYRFLNRQVPPDRERSVTHHSGFSRLVADSTAEHLRTAGWGKRMSLAGADLFVGGLEAAASRWVEERTCSAEELADRLTAVLWNGFVHGGMPLRSDPAAAEGIA